MEETKYFIGYIEKYGIRRILTAISAICCYSFSFLLWWKIYRITGSHFFVSSIAIPGQLGLIVLTVYAILFYNGTLGYESRLMKKVEHANEVFENPSDPSVEEEFRSECSKFIVPYLYVRRLATLGLPSFLVGRLKITFFVVGMLGGLYVSYSTFTLILTNQSFIIQMFSPLASAFPLLQDFDEFVAHNLEFVLILTFFLGLSYSGLIDMIRRPYLKFGKRVVVISFLSYLYELHTRIAVVIASVVLLPLYSLKREKRLTYEPFVFPTQLPLIMQKAVHNVGRKKCYVSRWAYLVQDEKDIVTFQNFISQETDLPIFIRWPAISVDPGEAVDAIKHLEPELYLGIVSNECTILGRISFDIDKKVRRAELFFDKASLKKEFKLIADKEIDKQRELEPLLPTTFKGDVKEN